MKNSKNVYRQNPEGIWEKNGIKLQNVARIKADKCFCYPELKRMIPGPNKLVRYDLTSVKRDKNISSDEVYSEKNNFSSDMYTVEVVELDCPSAKPVAFCLSLIDFCALQKSELIELYHMPKKVFEKIEITAHVESHVPRNMEEEITDIFAAEQIPIPTSPCLTW